MIRNQFPKKQNHLKFLQDKVDEVRALRPEPHLLFMHLGSSDREWEEGMWRIRNEVDDGERKRLVMSWRGFLDPFLLILIWVLSLSMVEESRGLTIIVAIFEGETFSLLSFWDFKSRIAIDSRAPERREKKQREIEMGFWGEKEEVRIYEVCEWTRFGSDGSEIWFLKFFVGFSISWRDFCFVFENGSKFSETWKGILYYGGNSRWKKTKEDSLFLSILVRKFCIDFEL